MLDKAGVKVGDEVIWRRSGVAWVAPEGEPIRMKVKGVHFRTFEPNIGAPAIELVDKDGRGYRAYPSEISLYENTN
jgi:hypothetical protein